MITQPVIVQTTIVSINVCVMDTNACVTGFFVCAAAAAIGELPSPDLLENTPLATPIHTVTITVDPRNPPAAADGVKALRIIVTRIPGRRAALFTSIQSAPTT